MDFLASDDALEITLGTEDPPAGNATALARDYRKRSGRAFGMIRSSTEPSIRSFISTLGHRGPARLWVTLRERYNTSASQSGRIATLERFHASSMKPDMSVATYIATLTDMRQELAGSEEEITETAMRSRILSTLPESFANIVGILKHKPLAEQTLQSIEASLVEHEASIALRNTHIGASTNSASTTGNALVATHIGDNPKQQSGRQQSSKRGGRGRFGRGGGKPYSSRKPASKFSGECWHCGKKGHREQDCFAKQKAIRQNISA